jgi:dihydrolipoamide dehydrogenase
MAARAFDCIVIGSGPGGYVAAIRAAQLGMTTAVVEKDRVGGRCLNYACIPAKAVLRAADVLSEVRDAGDFGIVTGEPSVDFAAVMARRDKVVGTLTSGVAGLFRKNGIETVTGSATLTETGTVRVGEDELSARTIVLATGSLPRGVGGIEFGGHVIGTEEAWALPELPGRIAVVGAGASGAEIASAYARLGTGTTLFEVLDRVLPAEDEDISKIVGRGLSRQGVTVHTSTAIENVSDGADAAVVSFGGEQLGVDWLVLAAGRSPDATRLGLDVAGIELTETGLVAVDGRQRTSREGVYAIGDLVPGPALAHKASDEGIIAVEDAAGLQTHPLVHVDIPRATFCMPNVASFGLTEAQAREQDYDVVVGRVPYGAVGAGTVYGDRSGIVKIVGERRYGELLGGHIVGMRATELIQELVNVRALEGGYAEVARIVHAHPTLSEAVLEVARNADGWLIHG